VRQRGSGVAYWSGFATISLGRGGALVGAAPTSASANAAIGFAAMVMVSNPQGVAGRSAREVKPALGSQPVADAREFLADPYPVFAAFRRHAVFFVPWRRPPNKPPALPGVS